MGRPRPRVVAIVGARPQFIKLAALLRRLDKAFDSRVAHTGQHYDPEMSGDFFAEYKLRRPDVCLNVGPAPPNRQLGRMLDLLDRHFSRLKPQAVLVFGDTTTTMAGAVAAAVCNIPVAHVEAGLRSFDLRMAEEKNRVIADHLSTWLFCPTTEAVRDVKAESIRGGVFGVGDVMAETFRIPRRFPVSGFSSRATGAGLGTRPTDEYYFVTVHRAEAVDDPDNLATLVEMIIALDRPVVFPVHPRTMKNLKRHRLLARLVRHEGIQLLPPINHHQSLWLIANAHAVLTDSGGVQKEAYWAGVRCLTLRTVTEWRLLVAAGWNELVGFSRPKLLRALRSPFRPRRVTDPVFARTNASTAIIRRLRSDLR